MCKLCKFLKRSLLLFSLLIVAFGIAACSKKDTSSNTVLVYICGSTLEHYNGYASRNIEEMLNAKINPNTTVIIEVGGSKSWLNKNISAEHIERYTIKNNQLVLLERLEQANMGSYETLKSFIDFGATYAPYDKISLIFWDHGGGTVDGVCADSNYSYDALTYSELARAFKEAKVERFEFIGMDACLMATYSFAELFSNYANYYIASEELISGTGWDYKTLLENIGTESFYDKLLSSYATKHSKKNTYTLSVVKLSEISKVREVVNSMADIISLDVLPIQNALSNVKEFGVKDFSEIGTGLYDIGLFAQALGVECDFSSFISTTNGMVHKDASGLSFYFPSGDAVQEFTKFSNVCPNQKYVDALNHYFDVRPAMPITFENSGYDNNGRMSFVLSEDSQNYVQSIGYELHSFVGSEETGKLYYVGTDDDILFENGIYTVDFQGNWVFINDIILHTDVYDVRETHTIFSSTVKINGEICLILFTYFKPTQTITIEGYANSSDLTSRIHNLEEGMDVTILYEDTIPGGDIIYYEEGTVTWGENVELSIKKLEEGYYQYVPYVIDIYGDIYYANTAIVHFDGERCVINRIAAG